MASRHILRIKLKKVRDAPAVLACERGDGSVTIARLRPSFELHDLTHYAVETTLGSGEGFFGLLAAGWDIKDFGTPWPRGPLPAEAAFVEAIVVPLWRDHMTLRARAPQELRATITESIAEWKLDPRPDAPSVECCVEIRERQRDLARQWARLGAGEALELDFSAPSSR